MFDVLEPEDPRQVGRYRIVARIGAGGMGRVYLGRSPGGRPVALKVVRPELAGDADFRRRFAREVAAARRVNGAFTAGVVDADTDGSPAWLATVYVSGLSLGEAVARHGPWPAGPVLALGAGLAEALEAIHAAGVVHRDLKPSNVLLAADGPRVIDFGISTASEASALTRTGTTIGTPGFMSPEQLTGRPVGPASDVFALGAVLAHTATGEGPFGTGTPHALHFRAVYEQPGLDGLPPGLREIVAACLAKEPERRPAVADLLRRLTTAAGGEAAGAPLPTEPDWMPAPVGALVRERTAAPLPRTPTVPDAASPQPAPHPATAPDAHAAATRTADQAPPAAAPPPVSRRGALLALTGAAVAGAAAFTAWKAADGGSGSAGPPPSTPRTPVRSSARTTTPTPAHREPGSRLWAFRTDDEVHTSPSVADGVAYFGSNDHHLYAVDAATGKKRWAFGTDSVVYSSPVVVDGVVYFGGYDHHLYAVDCATGRKRWSFGTGGSVDGRPAVAGGVVYAGSSDGSVYAVDAATGGKRWEFRSRAGGMVTSAVAVAGGVVYAGSWDKYLYAVDAATGRKRWEFHTGELVGSAPVVAGGLVHVSSGRLYALDAATGKQRWAVTGRKLKAPVTGYRTFTAPAVAGGAVYAGDEIQNLYALDAATGNQRWEFHTGNSFTASPAVADGVVYAAGEDGHVYALDARTGRRLWSFATGAALNASPTVASGAVYVGSKDGSVYALQK